METLAVDTSWNDLLCSYVCGLNSELFLHTNKNNSFFFAVRD